MEKSVFQASPIKAQRLKLHFPKIKLIVLKSHVDIIILVAIWYNHAVLFVFVLVATWLFHINIFPSQIDLELPQ